MREKRRRDEFSSSFNSLMNVLLVVDPSFQEEAVLRERRRLGSLRTNIADPSPPSRKRKSTEEDDNDNPLFSRVELVLKATTSLKTLYEKCNDLEQSLGLQNSSTLLDSRQGQKKKKKQKTEDGTESSCASTSLSTRREVACSQRVEGKGPPPNVDDTEEEGGESGELQEQQQQQQHHHHHHHQIEATPNVAAFPVDDEPDRARLLAQLIFGATRGHDGLLMADLLRRKGQQQQQSMRLADAVFPPPPSPPNAAAAAAAALGSSSGLSRHFIINNEQQLASLRRQQQIISALNETGSIDVSRRSMDVSRRLYADLMAQQRDRLLLSPPPLPPPPPPPPHRHRHLVGNESTLASGLIRPAGDVNHLSVNAVAAAALNAARGLYNTRGTRVGLGQGRSLTSLSATERPNRNTEHQLATITTPNEAPSSSYIATPSTKHSPSDK